MDEETREEQLDDEQEQSDVDAHQMIKQANAESDDDGDERNYIKK
jgi:hypothetical protein